MTHKPLRSAKVTAFVSAPSDANLGNLKNILQSFDVELKTLHDAGGNHVPLSRMILNLIKNSDLVIGIFDMQPSNNVAFELGLATALEKKIILLGSGVVPVHLSMAPVLSAPLSDSSALQFQLGAALENLDLVRPSVTELSTERQTERKSEKKDRSTGVKPSRKFEKRLYSILNKSPEINKYSVKTGLYSTYSSQRFTPDIAAWLESGEDLFSGPLIIEVKSTKKTYIDRKWIDQITNYTKHVHWGAGLLVIDIEKPVQLYAHNLSPLIFVVGLNELDNLINCNGLLRTMRLERNRLAHST